MRRNKKKKKIPFPRVSEADERAVREVLKHLSVSLKLKREGYSSCLTLNPMADVVRSIIDDLPPRQRVVIEYTVLQGHLISDVAKRLCVSERQIYRDRSVGIGMIALRLRSKHVPSNRDAVQIDGQLDVAVRHARALEQAGRLDEAFSILCEIGMAGVREQDRATVYCAAAHNALSRGDSTSATTYVDLAFATSETAHDDLVTQYRASAVLGELAVRQGRVDKALPILRRTCVGLRTLLYGPQHEEASDSLVLTLRALSSALNGAGNYSGSLEAAQESMVRLSEMARGTAATRIEVRAQIATTLHFLGSSMEEAEIELRSCYREAITNGLALLALDLAVTLATFYRLRGRPNVAMEFLHPLLNIAKSVSACRVKAFYYGSYATELTNVKELRGADAMLSEALAATLPEQTDLEALLSLVTARTRLSAGLPIDALAAARRAEVLFAELGRPGLLGVSLHLRSAALAGLGRHKEAVHVGRLALEALSYGHPRAQASAQKALRNLLRQS